MRILLARWHPACSPDEGCAVSMSSGGSKKRKTKESEDSGGFVIILMFELFAEKGTGPSDRLEPLLQSPVSPREFLA